MRGAEVCRYRGGSTSAVASGRYGGPKTRRRRRKYVKRRRRVDSSSTAVCSASWSFSWDDDDEGEDEDSDLEKKTSEVSSMGWNRTRATREPALH